MSAGRDITPVRPTKKDVAVRGAALIRVSNVLLVIGLIVIVLGAVGVGSRIGLIVAGAVLVVIAAAIAGVHARSRAKRMRS